MHSNFHKILGSSDLIEGQTKGQSKFRKSYAEHNIRHLELITTSILSSRHLLFSGATIKILSTAIQNNSSVMLLRTI